MTKTRLLFLVLVLGAAGCSGPPSLSGVVTLDGKPVNNAAVVFHPQFENAEMVTGVTDADGRFTITPAAGKSIAYGEYKVTVSKREEQSEADWAAFKTPKELLPDKYSNVRQTELKYDVQSASDLVFQLKQEPSP